MTFKVKDYYFKKAKQDNFLARSVYKLEEIDQRFKVLKKGDQVADLGYHPGSWAQYTSRVVADIGQVVGIDIKEVNKSLLTNRNIRLYELDAFEVNDLAALGVDKQFDVVLSDMAPNTMGVKSVDSARSLALVEKVFSILPTFLKVNGNIVVKIFDSNDAQIFIKQQRGRFKKFELLKPKSTRSVSKEFFVIGLGFLA